ncbi:hypothetical protein D3C87_1349900 [compost metagenome]
MVRIGIIVISICLMGCFGSRTEYGRKRTFNLERPKGDVNEIIYTLVDTTKLYKIVSGISIADGKPLVSLNKTYLKFYKDAIVGTFYSFDLNDINSLNPKKAEMGYYWYDKEGLQIKTFFEHPQGGGWVKENKIECTGDTLCFTSNGILTKYKAIDLPKKFLVFTPDW